MSYFGFFSRLGNDCDGEMDFGAHGDDIDDLKNKFACAVG